MQNIIIKRLSKKKILGDKNISDSFSEIMLQTMGDPGDMANIILNSANIAYIAKCRGGVK